MIVRNHTHHNATSVRHIKQTRDFIIRYGYRYKKRALIIRQRKRTPNILQVFRGKQQLTEIM